MIHQNEPNLNSADQAPQPEAPLDSWKEISAYLNRDERTARRWEKEEGLPVHRHHHRARASVYAYPSELDAWKTARKPRLEPAPLPFWRRPAPVLAFSLVLLLSLISVGNGPRFGPAEARAEDGSGMVVRQVVGTPGGDYFGGPSPDGRYLTYLDGKTGGVGIHDLVTGKQRLLTSQTHKALEYGTYSVLSPDGRQVAYSWHNKDNFYDLRVVGLDGSNPRVVCRSVAPWGWSPDGKQILALFHRKDGTRQIGFVSAEDGSPKVLKTFGWRYPRKMSLSPDGLYIIYDLPADDGSGKRDVFLLASDGSRETRLVEHPANDFVLGWAPDGKSVLFSSDRTGAPSAWVIQVSEGKPEGPPSLVRPNTGRMYPIGFTREGSFYYEIHNGMKDVYTATLDPDTGKLLTAPKRVSEYFEGANYGADWSPDGRRLAYVRRGQGDNESLELGSTVIIRNLETGREHELSPQLKRIYSVSWSPDGSSLVTFAPDLEGREGIYRIDPQTGAESSIVRARPGTWVAAPQWSPDGKVIYYMLHDNAAPAERKESIVARVLASGEEKEIHSAAHIHAWALSRDGRQLVLNADSKTNGASTNVLKAITLTDGKSRDLLTLRHQGKYFDELGWTRDGRHVLFTKRETAFGFGGDKPTELWRIPVDGGEPQKLGLAGEESADGRRTPSIWP